MKKTLFTLLLILLSVTACNKTGKQSASMEPSVSGSASAEPSISTSQNESQSSISDPIIEETPYLDDILEGTYNPLQVTFNYDNALACPVNTLPKFNNNNGLEGLRFFLNPSRINGNLSLQIQFCPKTKLANNYVIYTPDFIFDKTLERDDDVIEYVITKAEEEYEVSSISHTSQTKIPLNGLILSAPAEGELSFQVGQQISITNLDVNIYKSSIVNQDGIRIPFRFINNNYFFSDEDSSLTAYFDAQADSNIIQAQNRSVSYVKFKYDKENDVYKPEIFRKKLLERKALMDLDDDGFVLTSILKTSGDKYNILEQNIRIKETDTFTFESLPYYYNENLTFRLGDIVDINGQSASLSINTTPGTNSNANEWSYEVAVVNNRVVERAVNIKCPENGYVIKFAAQAPSNIESLSHEILKLFKVGTSVNYSNGVFIVNYNPEDFKDSYLSYADEQINNALSLRLDKYYDLDLEQLNAKKAQFDALKAEINTLNNLTTNNQRFYLANKIELVRRLLEKTFLNTISTEIVNMHTVWHYPVENNVAEIQRTLRNYKACNFNELITDVTSNGYALFKTNLLLPVVPTTKQDFSPYESYIDALVNEAHKLGLKVQAIITPWAQTTGIIEKYPEFADYFALNKDGEDSQESMDGIEHYFDPTNPHVQELILDVVYDLLNKHNFDGLHLDGIRYGASNDYYSSSQGITESAMEGFNTYLESIGDSLRMTSFDNFKVSLETPAIFAKFNDYRRNVITEFVGSCKSICNDAQVYLTAAVASTMQYAKNAKMQDWATWAEKGYIDGLYLMAYYIDEIYVIKCSQDMVDANKDLAYSVSGISPIYSALPIQELGKQINGANSISTEGSALFAGHSLGVRPDTNFYLNGETGGAYSKETITLFESSKTMMEAFIADITRRCNEIYQGSEFQTSAQKEALIAALNAIELYDIDNSTNIANLVTSIEALIDNVDAYASGEIQNRLLETFNYMIKVISIKGNIVERIS